MGHLCGLWTAKPLHFFLHKTRQHIRLILTPDEDAACAPECPKGCEKVSRRLICVDSGTKAHASKCVFLFSFLSSSLGATHHHHPCWEQISLFMGDVKPREEVSEEDKHKDKSSGRRLIFMADGPTAGEGFLGEPPLFLQRCDL